MLHAIAAFVIEIRDERPDEHVHGMEGMSCTKLTLDDVVLLSKRMAKEPNGSSQRVVGKSVCIDVFCCWMANLCGDWKATL